MVTAIRTDLEYQVLNSRADRNNPNNPDLEYKVLNLKGR
jgi:hypothetical protein